MAVGNCGGFQIVILLGAALVFSWLAPATAETASGGSSRNLEIEVSRDFIRFDWTLVYPFTNTTRGFWEDEEKRSSENPANYFRERWSSYGNLTAQMGGPLRAGAAHVRLDQGSRATVSIEIETGIAPFIRFIRYEVGSNESVRVTIAEPLTYGGLNLIYGLVSNDRNATVLEILGPRILEAAQLALGPVHLEMEILVDPRGPEDILVRNRGFIPAHGLELFFVELASERVLASLPSVNPGDQEQLRGLFEKDEASKDSFLEIRSEPPMMLDTASVVIVFLESESWTVRDLAPFSSLFNSLLSFIAFCALVALVAIWFVRTRRRRGSRALRKAELQADHTSQKIQPPAPKPTFEPVASPARRRPTRRPKRKRK